MKPVQIEPREDHHRACRNLLMAGAARAEPRWAIFENGARYAIIVSREAIGPPQDRHDGRNHLHIEAGHNEIAWADLQAIATAALPGVTLALPVGRSMPTGDRWISLWEVHDRNLVWQWRHEVRETGQAAA